MDWILLIAAGLFEVGGVVGLKLVAERNSVLINALMIGSFVVSLGLLRAAMETISLATAYSVWTGIGTAGATIVGIAFFREPKRAARLLCIAGIAACVIGLRFLD